MAYKINWALEVTVTETCDEGRTHILSDVGRSVGSSGTITPTTVESDLDRVLVKGQTMYYVLNTEHNRQVEGLYIKHTGVEADGSASIREGFENQVRVRISATVIDFQIAAGESVFLQGNNFTEEEVKVANSNVDGEAVIEWIMGLAPIP